MKYFKLSFLCLIFSSVFLFGFKTDKNLKTTIYFGIKESPKNVFKNDGLNAKDKTFLFDLNEKKVKLEKKLIKNCKQRSIGSISGYVFSFDGLPLEGIEIYLFPKAEYSPGGDIGIHYFNNFYSITDSSGYYSLFFEVEGDYILFASDPNGLYLPQYYNMKNSYDEADVINLKSGDNLSDLNFYLNKSASISGKVIDSKTGEGVWGIYIYTINPNFNFDFLCPYYLNTLTDDEGNYKLSGLAPGTYEIYAIDYGNFYGEGVYPEQITIIGSEDIIGIDFSLDPTDTGIKGKIFLPSEEPASGAWVNAQNITSPWNLNYYFTFTNSKGEYRIGAEEGKYLLSGGTQDFTTLATFYPGVREAKDAKAIKVEEGKILENIDFKLLPAGFIEGKVMSSSGEGIPSIFIGVFDNMGFPYTSEKTDEEGKFLIGGLDSGTYFIFAYDWGGDYAPQWYDGKKSFEEADPVQVIAGEVTGGIDFALNNSGKIKGKVIDSKTENPLKDIMIVAYNEYFYYESYGFSDEGGNFELKGLTDGSYIIFGFDYAGEYIPTYYDGAIDPADATPVYIQEGQEVNITFKMVKGGTIKGYVKTEENIPISYSIVTAYDLDGNWAGLGYGDEDGSYTIGGLLGGKYLLYAMDGNGEYAPKWYPNADSPKDATPINLKMGETVENINFRLPPAGAISGKVTDEKGNPLKYMYLFAEKIEENNFLLTDWLWGFTDENGNYTIKGLGTGKYIVGIILSNGAIYYYNGTYDYEEATPVSVVQGKETKDINFQIDLDSGGLSGLVVDSGTNEPIAFAYITVYNGFGIPISFAFTDEEGRYNVPLLDKGKYKVSAWADCYNEEWYKEKTNFSSADWIWLKEDEYIKDINFTLDRLDCIR